MTKVHLHRVEARLDRVAGGPRELVADPIEIGERRGRHQSLGGRTEPARRSHRSHPVGTRVGDQTGVPELRASRGALGVRSIGHPPQRDRRVRVENQAVPLHATRRRDRAIGNGRHADTTACHSGVELHQPVGDLAARRRALEGRGLDDPVAKRQRAESGRPEERLG